MPFRISFNQLACRHRFYAKAHLKIRHPHYPIFWKEIPAPQGAGQLPKEDED